MRIGIGTYAMFWEFQDVNPQPASIDQMIAGAADLDCDVFQICDDPRIEQEGPSGWARLRELAAARGIELELGTRTIDPAHLGRYIEIAAALGARTLRSMVQSQEVAGGPQQAVDALRASLPALESAGVTLALETYEQIPTSLLLDIVRSVGSERVGICLDPANCVAGLERPADVIAQCAPLTKNLHVKDFGFSRQDAWVGFSYSGAPLGEGLLDLELELVSVYGQGSEEIDDAAPSAIVEHWLPWQGDIGTTIAAEREWTRRTLDALRAWRAARTAAPAS